MRRRTVKGLHSSQQTVTRRHGRRQTDVFGVQSLVVMIFQLGRKRKISSQVRFKRRTIKKKIALYYFLQNYFDG